MFHSYVNVYQRVVVNVHPRKENKSTQYCLIAIR